MDDAQQLQVIDGEQAPTAQDSGALLSVIERVALNPNVNVDAMERLLAMQDKVMQRNAEVAYYDAMRQAQAEIEIAVRNKRNTQTNSNYADLTIINKAAMPAATSHGFSISFGTDTGAADGYIRVTADVFHTAGHTKHYVADVPIDAAGIAGKVNKTATHAFGSTVTYGRRYLLMLIFNISTSDDDGNAGGGSVQPITEVQAERLRKLIEETGSDLIRFCKWAGIDALPDLPQSKFDQAVAMLQAKPKKGGANA